MKSELADIVPGTRWGQKGVSRHGRLTWIDRQRASFENANNAISSVRRHSPSLAGASYSKTYVRPSAEERGGRPKAVGSVGGNVFGSQLGSNEKSAIADRKNVLLFAGLTTVPAQAGDASWLEGALEELATCPDDAIDDGFDRPSELGLIKAGALIKDLAMHIRLQPDIYPMDQGSIAIDIRHPSRKIGVLCLIERDGSGALFSRSRRSRGRIRVDDAAELLKEGGLSELRRLGISL